MAFLSNRGQIFQLPKKHDISLAARVSQPYRHYRVA
jgi:hypothetical protein